ncbi:polysaccharide biosynthesis protein [Desulfovibrio aerotolerans]|uniref:Polysaccharide biosynthesis protein n=1 Tax=Solidesulfovibrio aerotolerans TaxID=295255 RepID=A0A7C9IIV9_9BACT|nr:polysaccharide biosynthesis protein [Solidesulfovibrio aerotolerans]MYL81765.1 polysaccharide biosynthesis protein [Solidesulfovibrio aerotolerans]
MEVRQLLRLLWHRRRLMTLVFSVVFIGLAALTLLCETQYVASAKVYLYHSSIKATLLSRITLDTASMGAASLTDAERATYEDLAITVPVVRPLLTELNLKRKRKSLQILEFIPFMRFLTDRFLPNVGRRDMTYEELTNKSLVNMIFPRPSLKAAMMEDADILEFSSSAESLELAMALANGAAKSFVAQDTAMRQNECRELVATVDKELPRARADFEQALVEQSQVRQREKIASLDSEAEQLLTRYYSLAGSRDSNRLELLKAQGMLANVKAQITKRPEFRKTSESLQRSSLIDSIKLTLRDLYMDLAVAKTRMTPEHPQYKEIESKIEEAKKLIKGESLKVYGSETISTDQTFSYLNDRSAEYAAQIAGYESQDAAFGTLLGALEDKIQAFPDRAAADALAKFRVAGAEMFLSNLNNLASAAQAGQRLDLSIAHVVEQASRPGKIEDYMRPKLSLMLAVGLVLGCFLAVCAALVAAYADESVGSAAALAGLGAPVIAAVPCRSATDRLQAFRRLRDTLFPLAGNPPRLVLVADVAAKPPLDRDVPDAMAVVLGLGMSLARSGRSVAAVDTVLTHPTLHARTGLPLGPGLAEAIGGKVFRDAVILPGEEPGLFILPAGEAVLTAAAADRLLDSPAMALLLDGLIRRFDVVLLAVAPASQSGDAGSLARHADAILLTVRLDADQCATVAATIADLAAAAGKTPQTVVLGVPDDEPTPREVWTELRARRWWWGGEKKKNTKDERMPPAAGRG